MHPQQRVIEAIALQTLKTNTTLQSFLSRIKQDIDNGAGESVKALNAW